METAVCGRLAVIAVVLVGAGCAAVIPVCAHPHVQHHPDLWLTFGLGSVACGRAVGR